MNRKSIVNPTNSPDEVRSSLSSRLALLARAAIWRLRLFFNLRHLRFRGAYATFKEAAAAVRRDALVGYDNDAVVLRDYELMCEVKLEDYPVLFWLRHLAPQARVLLDAGGHMGTKYRAFRNHLELDGGFEWVVYDLPTIVRAGRQRAKDEGLNSLRFIDTLSEAPDADVLLASGLLQFLDIPFGDLLHRLPAMPRHLLLNKVQTREGPSVVTLENFIYAEVPYQIRDRAEFLAEMDRLGYDIVDEWTIPSLSHIIPTHPHLGSSISRGYYAKLRTSKRLKAEVDGVRKN
jgi:putative methyltransferase (TIGR04325 family)